MKSTLQHSSVGLPSCKMLTKETLLVISVSSLLPGQPDIPWRLPNRPFRLGTTLFDSKCSAPSCKWGGCIWLIRMNMNHRVGRDLTLFLYAEL